LSRRYAPKGQAPRKDIETIPNTLYAVRLTVPSQGDFLIKTGILLAFWPYFLTQKFIVKKEKTAEL